MSYLRNLLTRTFEPAAALRPLRTSLANSAAGAVHGFGEEVVFTDSRDESSWPVTSRRRGGSDPVEVGPSRSRDTAANDEALVEAESEAYASGEAVDPAPELRPDRAMDTERAVPRARVVDTEVTDVAPQMLEQVSVRADAARRRTAGGAPRSHPPGVAQAPEAVPHAEEGAAQSSNQELPASGVDAPALPKVSGEFVRRGPSRREQAVLGEGVLASAEPRGAVQHIAVPHLEVGRAPVTRGRSDPAGSRMEELRETTSALQALEARPMDGFERSANAPMPTSRYARRQSVPVAEPQVERAEPTVHITIGRLEVRGTAPAQAQRQAKATSAAPTLDEYLQARNRERRRE